MLGCYQVRRQQQQSGAHAAQQDPEAAARLELLDLSRLDPVGHCLASEADRAEHEDWHFARGLLRRETEADDARARARENGGGPAAKRRRRGRDGDARDVKQKTLFDAFRVGDG